MNGGDRSIAALGESLHWLPTAWLADAVAFASAGEGRHALDAGAKVVVATLIAIVSSNQVFSRSFARSVAMAQATTVARSSHTLARGLALVTDPLPHEIGALVVKEWLTIARDLKRLSGVIWPLGVVAIYGVSSSRNRSAGDDSFGFWEMNAALALVPWAISLG